MDIVEASNEFQDWELLHSNSDSDGSDPENPPVSDFDSGGFIQVDYFSLDSQNRRYVEELDDGKSVQSDNPSWIDPGSEENPTRYLNKEPGEFWSDSSSELSEDRKFSYFEGRNEMRYFENEIKEVGFQGIGGIVEKKEEKMEDMSKLCTESSGTEVSSVKFNDFVDNSEAGVQGNLNFGEETGILGQENSEIDIGKNKSGEIEKRVVWSKMPMEFLKYCVFRMSPVWTVSVAAAVMGFVILGRRLYAMKKEGRALEIKVAVNDKKVVSQVMSRVAHLNEAFSIVKRIPIIRPPMPVIASTSWPAMSLR